MVSKGVLLRAVKFLSHIIILLKSKGYITQFPTVIKVRKLDGRIRIFILRRTTFRHPTFHGCGKHFANIRSNSEEGMNPQMQTSNQLSDSGYDITPITDETRDRLA